MLSREDKPEMRERVEKKITQLSGQSVSQFLAVPN